MTDARLTSNDTHPAGTARRPGKRSAAAAALGLAAIAALAGCSAQGAQGTPESAGATGGLTQSAEVSTEEWQHEFDKCMTAEGVDLDAGIPMNADSSGIAPGASESGNYGEAQATCTQKIGPAPAVAGMPSDAEMTTMMLDFAKCMRAAGYDVPDPKPVDSSSGVTVQQFGVPDADPADLDRCSTEAGLGGPAAAEAGE